MMVEVLFSILNRNLPIYMNCPYCQLSKNKKDSPKVKFASTLSQLQRIFLVTPPFPVVLATCPVIQFAKCIQCAQGALHLHEPEFTRAVLEHYCGFHCFFVCQLLFLHHASPPSVSDREQKLQFNLGCQVVLPPESFLTLKLPFVYGVILADGNSVPLNALESQPEMTAWIMRGTALQGGTPDIVRISKPCNLDIALTYGFCEFMEADLTDYTYAQALPSHVLTDLGHIILGEFITEAGWRCQAVNRVAVIRHCARAHQSLIPDAHPQLDKHAWIIWELCSIVATWRQGSCTNSCGVQKGMQMEILRSCLDKAWTEGITLAEQWSLLCYRLAADTSFLQ
uniref:Nonsense-mediated mRNA decay factor SMG8 n=2 Tax=Salix viminalis TaxID=40686 RepID=A0A6N2KQV0_SALVM